MAVRKGPPDPMAVLRRVLGADIVAWARETAAKVAPAYDPPRRHRLPNHPDDVTASAGVEPAHRLQSVHRDDKGNLMVCIICSNPMTLDGRLCRDCAAH